MGAARRKDRREIDDIRPERLDVVEMRLDSAEIAAEPLVRGLGPAPGRQFVPVARNGPVGRCAAGARRREAIRKDLVHHGLEMPRGTAAIERQHEVVCIRNVMRYDS